MPLIPDRKLFDIIRADGRYPPEAYGFLLNEVWPHAVRRAHRKDAGDPPGPGPMHLHGSEICLAAKDLAVEKWGMLARTVLGKWNIRGTIDFGNMVYLLINHSMLAKTEEDSLEDFRDIYSFDEAFRPSTEFDFKE